MEKSIISLLGLADDGKRIYHFEAGEIDQEQFQYNVVMFNYLFDDEIGVIATLGPTWNMVHDPRFTAIENAFIRKRQARLGGDATMGRQKIGPFGALTGTVQDLDQYATILGEGRHFRGVMLKAIDDFDKGETIKGCFLDAEGDPIHPDTFYQDSDDILWASSKRNARTTSHGKASRIWKLSAHSTCSVSTFSAWSVTMRKSHSWMRMFSWSPAKWWKTKKQSTWKNNRSSLLKWTFLKRP